MLKEVLFTFTYKARICRSSTIWVSVDCIWARFSPSSHRTHAGNIHRQDKMQWFQGTCWSKHSTVNLRRKIQKWVSLHDWPCTSKFSQFGRLEYLQEIPLYTDQCVARDPYVLWLGWPLSLTTARVKLANWLAAGHRSDNVYQSGSDRAHTITRSLMNRRWHFTLAKDWLVP